MERLFVGGTNDGEWVNVMPDGIAQWRLPLQGVTEDLVGYEIYRPATFYADDVGVGCTLFTVYLIDGMDYRQALETLISGYRRPAKGKA